jgi:predicted ATP-grasp superfamily ATP-dependent carboligase
MVNISDRFFEAFNPIYYTHLKYVESTTKGNLIIPYRIYKENEKYLAQL